MKSVFPISWECSSCVRLWPIQIVSRFHLVTKWAKRVHKEESRRPNEEHPKKTCWLNAEEYRNQRSNNMSLYPKWIRIKVEKWREIAKPVEKRLEKLTIRCEPVIRTKRYDERPEAKTGLRKFFWISKETYSTSQTMLMELQKIIKRNNPILTKAHKGNSIVIVHKGDSGTIWNW